MNFPLRKIIRIFWMVLLLGITGRVVKRNLKDKKDEG